MYFLLVFQLIVLTEAMAIGGSLFIDDLLVFMVMTSRR